MRKYLLTYLLSALLFGLACFAFDQSWYGLLFGQVVVFLMWLCMWALDIALVWAPSLDARWADRRGEKYLVFFLICALLFGMGSYWHNPNWQILAFVEVLLAMFWLAMWATGLIHELLNRRSSSQPLVEVALSPRAIAKVRVQEVFGELLALLEYVDDKRGDVIRRDDAKILALEAELAWQRGFMAYKAGRFQDAIQAFEDASLYLEQGLSLREVSWTV